MIKSIHQKLLLGFIIASTVVAGVLWIVQSATGKQLGAAVPVVVANFQTTLQSSISSSDTSLTLVSGTDASGDSLSGYMCFTIDEGTSKEEHVCGTAAGTSVTGLIRGIDPVDGDSEVTSLKKSHRRGASVTLTNYPILGILARIINGDETIPNALSYESGVAPVSASDLVDKEYADALVGGGTLSYDRIAIAGTAGETVAAGDWVYLNATDQEWYLTDATDNDAANYVLIGVAQGAGTDGGAINTGVLLHGLDSNQTGLTVGAQNLSNTPGDIATSSGDIVVRAGIAISATEVVVAPRYNSIVTAKMLSALAGASGIPSATQPFLTTDSQADGGYDQTATVSSNTVEVGESDSSTNKVKVAQSFDPAYSSMRGVELFKKTDVGTFAGTVTVSLQADSSGEPSGTNLATKTITNAEWLVLTQGATFEVLFNTEYSSINTDNTYWIVVETSTQDDSNRINLGYNTTGATYSGGALYYNNTTDGWTAFATTDLYFKTIKGIKSKVVTTNSSGAIDSVFLTASSLPIPAFQQTMPFGQTCSQEARASGSNSDGSVTYLFCQGTNDLFRFERDSITGTYMMSHRVAATQSINSNDWGSLVVIGDYVYLVTQNANIEVTRFDADDLTGEVDMTVPTVTSNSRTIAWTDATDMYLISGNSSTTSRRWSISGTTMTAEDTASVSSSLGSTEASTFFDGSKAYIYMPNADTIYQLDSIDGTSTTSITIPARFTSTNWGPISTSHEYGSILWGIDDDRFYVGHPSIYYYDTDSYENTWWTILPVSKS